MKVFQEGKLKGHCDRCWKPLDSETFVAHPDHPGREFCSTDCAQKFIPTEYRCPDCVTKQIDPCVHARP